MRSTRKSACSAPSSRARLSAASASCAQRQVGEVPRRSAGTCVSSGPGGAEASGDRCRARACRGCGGRRCPRGRGGRPRAGSARRRPARSRPAACRSSSSSIAGRRPPGSRSACTSQKPMTAREVAMSSSAGTGSGRAREAMPKVTSRPNGASACNDASKTRPPVISRTMSTAPAVVGLEQGVTQVGRVALGGTGSIATSAPRSRARSRLSDVDARGDHPRRAQLVGPAARPGSRRRLQPRAPRPTRRARAAHWCAAGARPWCPAGRTPARWCRRPVRQRERRRRVGTAPARRTRRRRAAPRRDGRRPSTADHLGARDERQPAAGRGSRPRPGGCRRS